MQKLKVMMHWMRYLSCKMRICEYEDVRMTADPPRGKMLIQT